MIDVRYLFFKQIYIASHADVRRVRHALGISDEPLRPSAWEANICSEQERKIYCNEFLAKEDHDSVVHFEFHSDLHTK